ncbi:MULTISPECIES: hypothetical protein [unclassified Streptomyces]|uniref:hypothetical protein n=1 Tax=unclassified Streptomyces TaxID=2593676 RepID=UPI000F448CE6|nr:hypothetical protein [Streptomyces sp. I6]RNL73867.1 hypothetical protein EBF04_29385 [Streptomyces sp. I6]
MLKHRGYRVAGCLLAAVVGVAVAAPTASAQASGPTGAQGVHCSTGSFGSDGNQWYYNVSCSATGSTQWWANISCTDNTTRSAGPYTTFRNVRVYCPPNTLPKQGWVSYTL